MNSNFKVAGEPHDWPKDGRTPTSRCALIVVDMQNDYCLPGYYMDRAGYDVSRLSKPVARILEVLRAARQHQLLAIFTRHCNISPVGNERPSTLPSTARYGEPGWEIVADLVPQPNDLIVDKSTSSAFMSSNLQTLLNERGITHLAFCGNTIDVCVHSTLRTADDLKFKCLLLEDCCGAVSDTLHNWSIESVKVENGVFGTVANSQAFVEGLNGG